MIRNDPRALCEQAIAILDRIDDLLETAYQNHLKEDAKAIPAAA